MKQSQNRILWLCVENVSVAIIVAKGKKNAYSMSHQKEARPTEGSRAEEVAAGVE